MLYAIRTRDGREALIYVVLEHQSTFDARMPTHGEEDIVNAAEQLIEQGRREARNAAEQLIEQGRQEARKAAEQLIEQSRHDGREEGRLDTLRTVLADILTLRSITLSDAGRARIATCADVATLTAWTKRAATAVSEAEVLAPPVPDTN